MTKQKHHFQDGKTGSAIAIRITPRARKNEIVEILNDGTVKIRLTVTASEGILNQELIKYLSEVIGVAQEQIEIVAGQTGNDKLVSFTDVDASTVQKQIIEHLA